MASCNVNSIFRTIFIRTVFVGAVVAAIATCINVKNKVYDIENRALSIYRVDDQLRERLSKVLSRDVSEIPEIEKALDDRDERMHSLMDILDESLLVSLDPILALVCSIPLMFLAALFISKPATKLDDFAFAVAHDMRSPAESVVRDAKVASRGGEEGRKALETLQSEGNLMLKMYDDILETARNESGLARGELVDVDYAEMVEDVVLVYRSKLEAKGCRMVCDVPSEPVMVRAQRGYLQTIVINLVDNAVKFTDKGEVRVSLEPKGGKVVLRVQDTGRGMSEKCRQNAFVMFYREDMSDGEPGVGRGLARVKAIVDMYGGKIDIASIKGQGTDVTVTLPVDMKPSKANWLRRLAHQLS